MEGGEHEPIFKRHHRRRDSLLNRNFKRKLKNENIGRSFYDDEEKALLKFDDGMIEN